MPKSNPVREFICQGTLTLDGVTFFVQATSEDEAREKAAAGAWTNWEVSGASSQDWKLLPYTIEAND